MQAKFWNFAKRENSLKLPPASSPWTPDVYLKESTSLFAPKLLLGSPAEASEIWEYNYCYLEGVGYFFIDDWISDRQSLWVASCSMDLLATYREAILATTAFVEYDTTPNTWLVDHRLSVQETGTISTNQLALNIPKVTGGTYVVCVTGNHGSVSYYGLGQRPLQLLLNSVRDWSDINTEETENPMDEFILCFKTWATKALSSGSAPQNIRGCVWVPWDIQGTSQEIYLGTFATGQNGRYLANPILNGGLILAIPWQASDWRRCSMCHTIEVYLPYCGNVGIDAGLLAGQSEIVVEWSVDLRTGDINYLLFSGDTQMVIGSYSGCTGVSIPIGLSSYAPTQIVGSVSSAVASIAGGNYGAGAGSLAQAASNLIVPNVTAVGTQSSGAASGLPANENVIIASLFRNTNVAPSSVAGVMGTPAMAPKTLSALSGFVKCRGASVSADAGQMELGKINAYLNGGIWIE